MAWFFIGVSRVDVCGALVVVFLEELDCRKVSPMGSLLELDMVYGPLQG